MEQLLALEMIRVTEAAALASARFMGRGQRDEADQAATEAMRRAMDETDLAGTIVIGEGERDEAPMLYIGERVGKTGEERNEVPAIDIAVDPLEGTNLVALGQAGAITVLCASEAGGLTNAPDTYMEKLCVGPGAEKEAEHPVMEHVGEPRERDVIGVTAAFEHVLRQMRRQWSVRPEQAEKIRSHPVGPARIAPREAGDRRGRKPQRRLLTKADRIIRDAC